jgi:hypothetical protein
MKVLKKLRKALEESKIKVKQKVRKAQDMWDEGFDLNTIVKNTKLSKYKITYWCNSKFRDYDIKRQG